MTISISIISICLVMGSALVFVSIGMFDSLNKESIDWITVFVSLVISLTGFGLFLCGMVLTLEKIRIIKTEKR